MDFSEWTTLAPVEKLSRDVSNEKLRLYQKNICPDYDLLQFATSYRKTACKKELLHKRCGTKILKALLFVTIWKPLAGSLTRVMAAKPHIADV